MFIDILFGCLVYTEIICMYQKALRLYKKNPSKKKTNRKCKARSCAFNRWLSQIPVPKILRNIFEPSGSSFLFRIKITSFSAVKIYDIHIFICILHPRAYYELIESLRAQWIEHCTDIADVMDSNLVRT